jgi:hypothetical protein
MIAFFVAFKCYRDVHGIVGLEKDF